MAVSGTQEFQWTSELISTLIDTVREERVLYDILHPDYKKGYIRDRKMKEIASIFGCSKQEVSTKWTNLRTYFMREFRKTKASKPTGAGRNHVYIPRWEHYKELLFLNGISSRKSISNCDVFESTGEIFESTESQDSVSTQDTTEIVQENNTIDEAIVEEPINILATSNNSSNPETPVYPRRKRKPDTNIREELFKEAIQILKEPVITTSTGSSNSSGGLKDGEYYFGMHIASSLRNVSPRKRELVKLKIMETMFINTHDSCDVSVVQDSF